MGGRVYVDVERVRIRIFGTSIFMSERTVLVTFVDSDVLAAKVCLLLP
jgi:hypothetical protein